VSHQSPSRQAPLVPGVPPTAIFRSFNRTGSKETARLAGPRKRRSRWDTSCRGLRKDPVPPATQRLEEGEPWGTGGPFWACLRSPVRAFAEVSTQRQVITSAPRARTSVQARRNSAFHEQ